MRNPGPDNVADFLMNHSMILDQNHRFAGMLLHTDESCPIKIYCKTTISNEAMTTKFAVEYQPLSLDAAKNNIRESLLHPVDEVGNQIYQTLRIISKLLKKLLIENISERITKVHRTKK